MGENEQGALLRNLVAIGIVGILVGLFFTLAISQKKSTRSNMTATTTIKKYPQKDKPANSTINQMVDPDFTSYAKDQASVKNSDLWVSAVPNSNALEVTNDGPGGAKALHIRYGWDTLNVPLIKIPSGAKKAILKFDYRTEQGHALNDDALIVKPYHGALNLKTKTDQPIEDGYQERTLEYDLTFDGSIRWHLSSHDAFYLSNPRVTFESTTPH